MRKIIETLLLLLCGTIITILMSVGIIGNVIEKIRKLRNGRDKNVTYNRTNERFNG